LKETPLILRTTAGLSIDTKTKLLFYDRPEIISTFAKKSYNFQVNTISLLSKNLNLGYVYDRKSVTKIFNDENIYNEEAGLLIAISTSGAVSPWINFLNPNSIKFSFDNLNPLQDGSNALPYVPSLFYPLGKFHPFVNPFSQEGMNIFEYGLIPTQENVYSITPLRPLGLEFPIDLTVVGNSTLLNLTCSFANDSFPMYLIQYCMCLTDCYGTEENVYSIQNYTLSISDGYPVSINLPPINSPIFSQFYPKVANVNQIITLNFTGLGMDFNEIEIYIEETQCYILSPLSRISDFSQIFMGTEILCILNTKNMTNGIKPLFIFKGNELVFLSEFEIIGGIPTIPYVDNIGSWIPFSISFWVVLFSLILFFFIFILINVCSLPQSMLSFTSKIL
jgi:hypothetical protein